MAPNLTSKAVHLQDSFNSGSSTAARPTSLRIKSRVRTEFVVSNIFCHLLEDYGYEEQQANISPSHHSEVEVLEALKKVVNDFKMSYNDKIVDLCSQLDVTPENVNGVFLGVSNELFSEGITWARISTLFVFSSELAAQCLRKELPDTTVDIILDCCLQFVQNNLDNWVKDHGGWEGLVSFSNRHKKTSDGETPSDTPSPGWAKTVLHGTVRMFGTLAHIANSTGQMMALPIHNVRI